jgi:type I restriction-modification system DNA methylase subunit
MDKFEAGQFEFNETSRKGVHKSIIEAMLFVSGEPLTLREIAINLEATPKYVEEVIADLMKDYDVVLTNPPFGTKKGGERATRDDFTFSTSNKQLNFLQHIYRSLKADVKARAAVILPDNVLFADGDGQSIRNDLMDKCNLLHNSFLFC